MCKTFDETFFLRSFYLKYKVHIKCKVLRHLHISKVFHLIVYASPTWTRTAQNQPVCNPYSIFCYIFPALHKGPYVHKNKHLDCPGWSSPYWIKLIWLYEGRLEPQFYLQINSGGHSRPSCTSKRSMCMNALEVLMANIWLCLHGVKMFVSTRGLSDTLLWVIAPVWRCNSCCSV